jgi:hypothetical protein
MATTEGHEETNGYDQFITDQENMDGAEPGSPRYTK